MAMQKLWGQSKRESMMLILLMEMFCEGSEKVGLRRVLATYERLKLPYLSEVLGLTLFLPVLGTRVGQHVL